LAIEEQAYPFEEKAIQIHEKNLELISNGYLSNPLDDKPGKIGQVCACRYDKPEILRNYCFADTRLIFQFEKPVAVQNRRRPEVSPRAKGRTWSRALPACNIFLRSAFPRCRKPCC
jgi:hypothetical protein